MPGRHRIMCIQRGEGTKPHEMITHIGGRTSSGMRWKLSLAEAILGIRDGLWAFYVGASGESLDVVVTRDGNGAEYLKTGGDATEPRHLLDLPDCRDFSNGSDEAPKGAEVKKKSADNDGTWP
jgi:hypothetical protein